MRNKITGLVVRLFVMITIIIVSISACDKSGSEEVTIKVAGLILKWIPEDVEANYNKAEILIREAAANGAKLICTTECFLDGYSARNLELSEDKLRSLAEPIPDGVYFKKLRKLCDELDIYLAAAITELDGEKIYNSTALIGPDGKHIGTYRKKYLWVDEEGIYTPGKRIPTFETEFGKIGFMICYDRQFPEAMVELKDNGARLVICAGGGDYGAKNDQVVSQRSKEGNVPIVYVHPIEFLVTGANGQILKSTLDGNQMDWKGDKTVWGRVEYYDLHLAGIK
ncbi:MAG: carbon-nitrogen hydrolase family protein [candidate division Zixibacteria bacterium]|nr:carbon-nitrogen hydrolase family protein [candidate division Zixibacteria bacterium]